MDLPHVLALLADVAIRMDDTAAASTALDEAREARSCWRAEATLVEGPPHTVAGATDGPT